MQVIKFPSLDEKPIVVRHIEFFIRKQITNAHSPSFLETMNDFTSLIFIESGTAFLSVGDRNYILESGNVFLVPPSQFHIVKSADGLPVSYIYTAFSSDSDIIIKMLSKPLVGNANYNYLSIALENAEKALHNIIDNTNPESAVKEIFATRFRHSMQIAYNCLELFILNLSSTIEIEHIKESHKQTRHANITASVEEYLKERVKENISLQETAQHFGYSVSNIQKIFKAVTGQSIIVYFNKLKLEEAKRLIIENSMTFSQISSYLSFSNPNYFSRIFKTTVGMTPTEYANLHQQESDSVTSDKKAKTSKRSRRKN